MFITLQFPIIDYRFLQFDFIRTKRPNWPNAEKNDYVRYIGHIFDRRPPYLGPYDGEKKYCSASHVINLCGTGKEHFFKSLHHSTSRSRILFRRFQSDGNCLAKFEIGFDDEFESTGNAIVNNPNETGQVIFKHIEKYLLCPVKIKIGNKLEESFVPLIEAGKHLKNAFYWATAKKKRSFDSTEIKNLVESCEPAVYIQVDSDKLDLSVFNSQKIEIPGLSEKGIQLYYQFIPYTIDNRNYHLKAWIIGVSKSKETNPVYASDFEFYNTSLRYLRINLLRIHIETITLKKMLEAIGNPDGEAMIKDQATKTRVFFYLHKVLLNLSKIKRNDQPQDKLVEKAFRLDTSYYGSESIEDRIEGLKIYIDWIKELPVTSEHIQMKEKAEESFSDIQKRFKEELSVFISYNHADEEIAREIKEFLEKENIKVIIDSASMSAGENIEEFIIRSIRESQVTLAIVSANSLNSGWVSRESINTFNLEKFSDNKKFIACYLDDSFFADDFVLNSVEKFKAELDKIYNLIDKHNKAGIDSATLNSKKSRLIFLKDNLDPIVDRLTNSLTVDIRQEKKENGLKKVLSAIRSMKKK